MDSIICKLNKDDDFNTNDESLVLDFTNKKEYSFTFYKQLTRLYRMHNPFQNEALDLLYISMAVFYVDRKFLRSKTHDGWTRNLKIFMPVLSLDKWVSEKDNLEKLLSFLSGDIWTIEFRSRELNALEKKVIKKINTWYKNKKFEPDEFCMLSGGLDSFIGAIDLLSTNKKIAFIGLYGGGKGVKPYQDKVNKILQREFKISDEFFFNFYAATFKGEENTTRTRSFLFFSHAIILASCLNRETNLYIPENGLISLNIPLTNTRLGSSSTRTTHPYYMKRLQSLLNSLGIKVNLINPYQFKTKGEMLLECKNPTLISKEYKNTMSCSHPDQVRYQKGNKSSCHCGTCLPCSIRRASILKAFKVDYTVYDDSSFKMPNAQTQLKSFKSGILEYQNNKSNPLVIQISGPIDSDYEKYYDTYLRGMKELEDLLNTI